MSRQISDNPFHTSRKFAGKKLHLGISGSIACYKAADLLRAFIKLEIGASAALSPGAREFITPLLIRSLGADPVHADMFSRAAPFAHLAPGQEADAMLIAPASADICAKIAHGLADDLLCAQALAFSKPIVIAPAMNPRMWANPATKENMRILAERWARIVAPGIGKTACGEEGQGRLAPLPDIFLSTLKALSRQDMLGLHVLVTLGPTREYWDCARFWSNPSSGKMGAALATAAWLRGAKVAAIRGPGVAAALPPEVAVIDACSAKDMLASAEKIWPGMDIGIFCAAVADFAPRMLDGEAAGKFHKHDDGSGLSIEFNANPDILASLAVKREGRQRILGFAAQAEPDAAALLRHAKDKLDKKGADMIAANHISAEGGSFGADGASMAVVDKNGASQVWEPKSKADIAWDLLSWLLRI